MRLQSMTVATETSDGAENLTLVHRVLLKTFQNLSVSSPAPVTMASPSGDTAWQGEHANIRRQAEKMHNAWICGTLCSTSAQSTLDSGPAKLKRFWQIPAGALHQQVKDPHQVKNSVGVPRQFGHLR